MCFNAQQAHMKVFFFISVKEMAHLIQVCGVFEEIMHYIATEDPVRKPQINLYKLRNIN
jgi:hypothetical protein